MVIIFLFVYIAGGFTLALLVNNFLINGLWDITRIFISIINFFVFILGSIFLYIFTLLPVEILKYINKDEYYLYLNLLDSKTIFINKIMNLLPIKIINNYLNTPLSKYQFFIILVLLIYVIILILYSTIASLFNNHKL